MEKLKMQSENKIQKNLGVIAKYFPNVITENESSPGGGHLSIDFELLCQELSDILVDGHKERYQFEWPGKRQAILNSNSSITATLRPCREESVDFETTENLYIEGDNLDVLKLLQETYLGKIKMIYIDPPYNTGNDNFVYDDSFCIDKKEYANESGQYDENSNELFNIRKNNESNGRFHTDWLNMIYPRIKLAKDLLMPEGVICISIDDNEQVNLKKICDEIFGENNFIGCFVWNCSTAGGIRPKFASKTHEYILCYAKNRNMLKMLKAPLSSGAINMYNKEDKNGIYRDKDFIFKNKSTNVNQKYEIVCPDGEKVHPKEGYIYRFIKNKFNEALSHNLVTFKKTNTGPLLNSQGMQAPWNIYIKKYLGDAMGAPSTLIPKEIVSIYNVGTQCVQSLFNGNRVFDNVKPVDLIEYFIKMLSGMDEYIVDFFSGSATTAHAVMQLNAEDGGTRKYIMVQLPEVCDEKSEAFKAGYKNICEIGKERIRRAAKKIQEEHPTAKFDAGFRVLKLDSSNMKDVYYKPAEYQQEQIDIFTDNVKVERTTEDLLFQVMLDVGALPSSKVTTTVIGKKKIFNVADNYLLACFETNVSEEVVKNMAKLKPIYAVFRDNGFANDDMAANSEQLFKTLSPNTKVRVL